MSEIQPFSFEGSNVRTIAEDEAGLFVASDIAKILGHRDAANLTRTLDDDEKGTREVSTPRGVQNMTVITEAGLYRAILNRELGYLDGEQKEFVRRFQRWVTHEVLPTIRKHGAYATEATIDRILANPDFGIKLLTDLKEERAKRTEAEKTIERQKPLVTIAQEFIQADGTITITDAARYFKQVDPTIKRETVFNVLRAYGYIERRTNKPTMKAITPGYLKQKPGGMHGGKLRTSYVVFTPKGVGWYLSNFICNIKGEIS